MVESPLASGGATEVEDAPAARPAAGLTPLIVTIHEAQTLPAKDAAAKTDPFVVIEAAGVRSQTDVQRGTVNPAWDQMLTLRCVFAPGMREELVVTCYHEDVFEDVVVGRGVLDISAVLHERETLDEWLELLDEHGRRAIGADIHLVVANGKAPPLMALCADEEVTLEDLERSITQEPAQCDEREVDEATGRTCLHLLLANQRMDDEMLSLLLKCNPKQARVADRHGTLPLSMLCRRYGLTEAQLTLMVKCHPPAARTPNRFGKLPLHFLARNPSLTKPLLAIGLAAFPGAAEAKDMSGNLPLHHLSRNKTLSKDLLQAYLDACGAERARAYADTPNKLGRLPLRELVISDAFTDQHLRVMLRVSEQAAQSHDRYGHPPLHYLGWNVPPTPFMEQVAEEAAAALDERAALAASSEPVGRFVDDGLALKLLLNVQKYSLWFHDFAHADMRKLQHGSASGEHRLLVTRFAKGDYIMRKGEAATFLAILLQGELGVRIGKGGGFPRRLHKGALFGERGMFSAGNRRAADIIALSDGYVGTMLFSEIELLGESHPQLMRTFNLQMAKGALEEKLADTGMSVDDLEQPQLERQINELLTMQASARWKARHAELQGLREGLYADLHAEKEARAIGEGFRAGRKARGKGRGLSGKALASKGLRSLKELGGRRKTDQEQPRGAARELKHLRELKQNSASASASSSATPSPNSSFGRH